MNNSGHARTHARTRARTHSEELQGHLCLPQQGRLGGRGQVTILALGRLLGDLFINVPRRHPEPQHGRQRGVVQHHPDLRWGGGEDSTHSYLLNNLLCILHRMYLR